MRKTDAGAALALVLSVADDRLYAAVRVDPRRCPVEVEDRMARVDVA